MATLTESLNRHQLIAYFILTYGLTWTLLLLFQPLYLFRPFVFHIVQLHLLTCNLNLPLLLDTILLP